MGTFDSEILWCTSNTKSDFPTIFTLLYFTHHFDIYQTPITVISINRKKKIKRLKCVTHKKKKGKTPILKKGKTPILNPNSKKGKTCYSVDLIMVPLLCIRYDILPGGSLVTFEKRLMRSSKE